MKKLVYTLAILSALPGVILIPLTPFPFLLIDGEGRIPGMLHERICIALLLLYPVILCGGLWYSLTMLRRSQQGGRSVSTGVIVATVAPLVCAVLLVWVFVAGGVRLR